MSIVNPSLPFPHCLFLLISIVCKSIFTLLFYFFPLIFANSFLFCNDIFPTFTLLSVFLPISFLSSFFYIAFSSFFLSLFFLSLFKCLFLFSHFLTYVHLYCAPSIAHAQKETCRMDEFN